MLAGQGAIGACPWPGIDCRNRVQVRKWELHDGTIVIGARDQALIGIPEAVHLSAPVADICRRKHRVLEDLILRTETCLLHVTGALVGILSTQLQLG